MTPNLTDLQPPHPQPTTSTTRLTHLNRTQQQLHRKVLQLSQKQRRLPGQTPGQLVHAFSRQDVCFVRSTIITYKCLNFNLLKFSRFLITNVCVCVCVLSYQDQSGEQGEEYETEDQLQARILTAALDFVPLHGWSMEAIASGAEVSCKQLEHLKLSCQGPSISHVA